MAIIFVIFILIPSTLALVALFRRLRRHRTTFGRWVAFGVLVASGVGVGIWCASYLEYHIGSRYRISGFPIPVAFFHLERGEWVDFPVSEFQAWEAMLANVITITALATLPLWLISWRQYRHESKHTSV